MSLLSLKVLAGKKVCSAQAAVQMLFRRTKNTHSLQSKNSQNRSFKFIGMEKQATFLTLLSAVQVIIMKGVTLQLPFRQTDTDSYRYNTVIVAFTDTC